MQESLKETRTTQSDPSSQRNIGIDDTGFGQIRIMQDRDGFCYGSDAVMLAAFTAGLAGGRRRRVSRICDLGTGTGIVPLILSHKTEAERITGLEIMASNMELAVKNAALNHLEERVAFVQGNAADLAAGSELAEQLGGAGSYDVVTSNPPYTPSGRGMASENEVKYIARHEAAASLEEFLRGAALLLRDRGEFFMVHRPHRLTDILAGCRQYRLEPRTMQLVSGRKQETPNIVLLHCVKNGGTELKILPQTYVREDDGSYSPWMLDNYEREKE